MDLPALAAAHGVATSYDDWSGRRVQVARESVVAALSALGVDASTDDAVSVALTAVEKAPWSRPLPPSIVVRESSRSFDLHVPVGADVRLEVVCENAARVPVVVAGGEQIARRDGLVHLRLLLPPLPLGWHVLNASYEDTGAHDGATDTCHLVVAPDRLPELEQRHWGWQVQLYAVRSQDSWGMGDYADLRTIVAAAAADGAGALLLNPIHAETPVLPVQPSPYSPSSRLFRSPVGLRLEDVPEAAGVDLSAYRPPTDPDRIDRDAVWAAKLAALQELWPLHRAGRLARFRAERGHPLEDFALFCALAEVHGVPWQEWPAELRDPKSEAVATARVQLADGVSFWCWVQLLVDEQLAGVGDSLAVGVLHDLAVGVDAGGADAWAMQDVVALGTTVGAPPDLLAHQGQDWGLPPWRPDRLREHGYVPFREMVRGVLRHAGGLRIDHVMGLSRLWWVPAGRPAAEGTYVSYDADALLGVLALEASRAGAVVVGEDLGTVQDSVRQALEATGVLGSEVLWFRTAADGSFLPPSSWRRDALASVTTHDLPTVGGFLAGEHVRVRADLGLLPQPLEDAQAQARREREQLVAMLEEQGLLADGDVALAMHRALVASPCRLVLASYADAVGDLRQPNVPGTVDSYPNWRLPIADAHGRPVGLEQLLASGGVRRLTQVLQQMR